MRTDAIDLVESAYELEASDADWMRTLVERTIPLVPEARAGLCFRFDFSNPEARVFGLPVTVGFPVGFEHGVLDAANREDPTAMVQVVSTGKVSTASEQVARFPVGPHTLMRFIRDSGARDAFGCVASDAEGRGLIVSTSLPRVTKLPRALRARWRLLGVHIATAQRLRARASRRLGDECVLSPGGSVLHAQGPATERSARERLHEAVVARDRARTRRTRAEPDEALTLWRGLVAGRWSLLDRFERDGRRYVVARRNEPRPESPLALTLRERQVLGHLVQGDSVKVTAYALGRAPSTVSETARTVLLKFGVRSAAELARLASLGGT